MRKNKALFMWGAVATVAIAAAVFEFQWEKLQEEKKSQANRVFRVESSQVAALEVTGASFTVNRGGTPMMTNKFRVEKTTGEKGDAWFIKSPIEERADQDEVQGFIEGLVQERATEVSLNDPSVDWSQFGLDKPMGSLQIFDRSGQSSMLSIGSRKNFQGDAYLRRGDESKVLLGTSSWFGRVEKTLLDFRDKRILRHPSMTIQSVKIQQGNKLTQFQLKDARWFSPDHPEWKLDQTKVREVLAALVGDVISDFTREGEVPAIDLKEWGLSTPALTLSVMIEGQTKPWTAEISKVQDHNHFIKVSDPAMVVSVMSAEAGKFFDIDLQKFRDPRSPFDFDQGKVAKVEVKLGKDFFKAQKSGTEWSIVEKSIEKGVDQVALTPETVTNLLKRLRDLEVEQFSGPAAAINDSVATQIRLSDEQDQTLLQLVLGEASKNKKGEVQSKATLMAKSNLSTDAFTLEQEKAQELGINLFLPKELRPVEPSPATTPVDPVPAAGGEL